MNLSHRILRLCHVHISTTTFIVTNVLLLPFSLWFASETFPTGFPDLYHGLFYVNLHSDSLTASRDLKSHSFLGTLSICSHTSTQKGWFHASRTREIDVATTSITHSVWKWVLLSIDLVTAILRSHYHCTKHNYILLPIFSAKFAFHTSSPRDLVSTLQTQKLISTLFNHHGRHNACQWRQEVSLAYF